MHSGKPPPPQAGGYLCRELRLASRLLSGLLRSLGVLALLFDLNVKFRIRLTCVCVRVCVCVCGQSSSRSFLI